MRTLFADTGYWIALLNPQDDLHGRAESVSRAVGPFVTVTTEMVLTELLNAFAERGSALRRAATELIARLRNDPNTRIVPQTSMQFDEAVRRYVQMNDKRWSQTDCASFNLMAKENISEALAHDKNFEQAGYVALLRTQL